MANPQCEDGYIKISNEFFEALIRVGLPQNAMQVFLVIIRWTWGFNRKETRIRLKDFCNATGMKKVNVSRELRRLKEANMFISQDNPKGLTYRIQKDYEKWKRLSPQIRLSRKITKGYLAREPNVISQDNQNRGNSLMDNSQPDPKDNIKDNIKNNQDDSFKKTSKDPIPKEAHDQAKSLEGDGFNSHQFIEVMSKAGHHPEDILTCMSRLKDHKGKIKNLWGYGEGILAGLVEERRFAKWEATKEREKQEVKALVGREENSSMELTDEECKKNRERVQDIIQKIG